MQLSRNNSYKTKTECKDSTGFLSTDENVSQSTTRYRSKCQAAKTNHCSERCTNCEEMVFPPAPRSFLQTVPRGTTRNVKANHQSFVVVKCSQTTSCAEITPAFLPYNPPSLLLQHSATLQFNTNKMSDKHTLAAAYNATPICLQRKHNKHPTCQSGIGFLASSKQSRNSTTQEMSLSVPLLHHAR